MGYSITENGIVLTKEALKFIAKEVDFHDEDYGVGLYNMIDKEVEMGGIHGFSDGDIISVTFSFFRDGYRELDPDPTWVDTEWNLSTVQATLYKVEDDTELEISNESLIVLDEIMEHYYKPN